MPTGQWSEPCSAGQMKAPCTRSMASGEGAEGVGPARLEPVVHLRPLLGQESAVLDVCLRPGEIDLTVGGVVVADDEHRALAAEVLHPVEDRAIEVELVGHPAVVAILPAPLGEIAVHHREGPAAGPEVGGDEPPLDVEPRFLERGLDPLRLDPRVDPDPAVAPALGRRERRMPAGRRARLGRDLVRERPYLLHPEHIRLAPIEEIGKPPLHAGADAVDVPAYDPHGFSLAVVRPPGPFAVPFRSVSPASAGLPALACLPATACRPESA